MVLDVTVLQLVHLVLAVCVSKLCHDKISMKGLVQVSIMAHPAGWCAVVLLVTAVHVCRAAEIFSVIDCARDAVHIVSLARSSLLGAASSSLPLTAAPSNIYYVYCITCTVNDRKYVSSATDMHRRYKEHNRTPPSRMRHDADLYKPFHANFVMTDMPKPIADETRRSCIVLRHRPTCMHHSTCGCM